jgi:hypothetical protein
MPSGVSAAAVDAVLSGQLDLLRMEAGLRSRVVKILGEMQAELTRRLAEGDISSFTRGRLQDLLRQATATIDSYYARLGTQVDAALRVAGQASAADASVAVGLGAALPTETFFSRLASRALIHGAPSAAWWARQAKDTAFRFSGAVRQGAAQGETNEQIVARVAGSPRLGLPGIMDTARANARALVHSSVQTAANSARMETFRQNRGSIKGVRQLSTFDSHTTPVCVAYSGQEWDLDGNPINGTVLPFANDGGSPDGTPRHWGCRSVMVPITKTLRELGIDADEIGEGTRASSGGPVRSKMTMAEWLSRRTEAQQDAQLGKGRAQLWRDGKITLEQLLNLSGNPLTAAELAARYG